MFPDLKHLLIVMLAIATVPGCKEDAPPLPGGNGTVPDPAQVDPAVPAASRKLTKEDYQTAIRLKNRGLGHLENKEWASAETTLSELARLLPESRTAVRNLAVSRVLALIDRESPFSRSGPAQEAQKHQDAVAAAAAAIEVYRDRVPQPYDQALADLLQGLLLVHNDAPGTPTFEQGLNLTQQASDAASEQVDFRFALAMAMDGHRDYADADSPKSADLLRVLQQCFEQAPQNLFALQKLMQRQALCLNSKNEQTKTLALQITETLRAATELLRPLNESIKKQRRMDLIATINGALEKFDGSNPAALMGPAMMTGNLLLPEIATQIDQRRINRNLLEYLLLEFDESFLAAAQQAGAIPALPPTVVQSFVPDKGLPALTKVTQVELLDMNLDGFDDLVVARDGNIEVYSRGQDLTAEWTLLMSAPAQEVRLSEFLLADIDRDYDRAITDIKNPLLLRDADGDQKIVEDPAGKNRWYDTDADVIAWGSGGVVIFRNSVDETGQRLLEIVPQQEAVSGIRDIVAADLESDGDLDLVFATEAGLTLWKNLDGTTFENMNQAAALPDHELHSLAVVDLNRDVAMDVVGVSSQGEVGYLENMFHGRFRWLPLEDHSPSNLAFVIGDPDGDLQWDLIDSGIAGPAPQVLFLFTADLDNDGYADLVRGNDGQTYWFRGLGNGRFEEEPAVPLPDGLSSSGGTAGDLDDDGDLDLVLIDSEDGALQLLTNNGGNTNNWIDVVARAVPDDPQFPSNRVNMHGIGSVIELRTGSLYHAEVITTPKVHLGLGQADAADTIRIIWTDGIPQNITVPNLLRPRIGVLAPQILKGSCPYIYTWTGDRFEFFSDCLWAAPLGLVQASGELAPTREWENLLIPGESLVAKDGRYVLQLTEELWETAYFDQVQLTAIDHPADVAVFTNEKVGPPDLAEHRVHTVRNPRYPVSVVDGRGRDLRPELKNRDGAYVQAFNSRVMQGLTDEWVMEFDLGELQQPVNIRLFLTGWVFPTDTSLNLAIQQNPGLQPPAPPSIEVPDRQGGWTVVRPFIGFPSGKTKAMVVDISDIFTGDDYRFRIRSSMELYWDQAFFTVDENDAATVVQPCKLVTGDLHYRGFSRRVYDDKALFRNGRAPESYDYQSVTTEARWPTIHGRFTRYGQTTPLLLEHDDAMVVMGPGDELTVEFAIPAQEVPEGWTRDFVLTNVGYDKDADLNTIYGQSAEPFPFRSMKRYPFAADEQAPQGPEYQRYLDEWQTREYSRLRFLNQVRDR
ncbi:MAG: CRTAC1 family protein [Fuerstiella sp.]